MSYVASMVLSYNAILVTKITAYMEPLVKALEEVGYRNGKNLFGAPYDFRYGLAADSHPRHANLKFLEDLN
ncbi:hypothetical protein KY290_021632 [Solanum tuberosum]|uniref:Uncharacterized protein n=1 Tax=Solanum tuberosum TaxID=4113 RepID=A0ABQ7V3N5_SOLTU|nr:hypothetical protein KY289_022466 [Solanum tuberosum]KAH0758139.1 hypothetical protein KY290_021632 [Solanum tuberosum]